ncbi:DUF2306 domain-containing protein [Kitasatospora sp. NPDC049285]|uniref:DUF2306 domain-containing protein n=1 Tax=Kitasatospora sp. NPDC049285 TaxID=3157096 RepID=UPI00341EEA8A
MEIPTAPRLLPRHRVGLGVVFLLAAAIALLSARYFALDPDSFLPEQRDTYLAHEVPLLFHIGGGTGALLLGPCQFLPRLRARRPAVHRVLGRLFALFAAATGVGGLLLTPYGLFRPAAPLGFAALAVGVLTTVTLGVTAARRGRIARHRVWMVRCYALIFTGVTFRLWLMLLGAAGVPFEQAYVSGAWAAWLLNLAVAERLLRPRT